MTASMIYIQYPLNFGALIFLPPPTGGKLNPPSFLFSLLVVVCHLMVDVDAWCFVVILVFSILFVCLFRGCACINWCENLRS